MVISCGTSSVFNHVIGRENEFQISIDRLGGSDSQIDPDAPLGLFVSIASNTKVTVSIVVSIQL
jgi:hypothetical protein